MIIQEWVWGLIFQLSGSFFSNLGINIQAHSHKMNEQEHNSKPYYKTPLWLLGFASFCFGECMAGVASAFLSQSLLAVIASYSLILNGLFHTLFNKTRLRAKYITSSLIIMAGSCICVLSSTHKEQSYNLSDLAKLFHSWLFLIFLILLFILLAILFLIRAILPQNPTLLTTISSFMACLSVLLSKCFMQLLKTSILGDENQFLISAWPWIIMVLFALFATLNVHFMNLALRISKTTKVYPLYYATSTVLVILMGMAFFREYSSFTFWQSTIFTFGVSICLTGIQSLQDDDEDYDDLSPASSALNNYPTDFFLKSSYQQSDSPLPSTPRTPWLENSYQASATTPSCSEFDDPRINLSYSSLLTSQQPPTRPSPVQIATPVNAKINPNYVRHADSERINNFFQNNPR